MKDRPLSGWARHDDIEGGDAVRCHDEQRLAYVVGITLPERIFGAAHGSLVSIALMRSSLLIPSPTAGAASLARRRG